MDRHSLWKFVNWIGVSLQFREIWKFNVPVNLVGFCKCLWITFGQIYYIITWLNNNGMDNRTNLSTTNNGVDNLPKSVQKRSTICPKHLQDHTKTQWYNNLSYFFLKIRDKAFTYLEFHKNTLFSFYLCQQTDQMKNLASLCTSLSATILTVSVFISIFTNLRVVSLRLGTMASWTLTGSRYCLTSVDESLMVGEFYNSQFVLHFPN